MTKDKETLDGAALWFNYGYDSLGRMTTLTYPETAAANRLKLTYAYDGNGNLASVTDATAGTVYWQHDAGAPAPAVNAWGEAEAWTLGSGTDVTRLHDPATGFLTNVSAGPNHDGSLVNLSYGYDALGNVNEATDAIESVSQSLGYDGLNRLTSWTVYNPNAPNGMGRGAGYDAGGDIKWRTLVGNYDYGENGAPPHAVTTITHQGDISHYGYDGAGRMTTVSYAQTVAANRLKLDYTRDGNGNFDSVTDSNDDTAVSAGGRNSHIGRLHRVS